MINEFFSWLDHNLIYKNLALFFFGVLIAFIAYLITKFILIRAIKVFVQKSKTAYDDILVNDRLLRKISFIAPLLIISHFTIYLPYAKSFLNNFFNALTAFIFILVINTVLTSANEIYEQITEHNKRPLKGYIQVVKIVVFIIGIIIVVGILTGRSIWELLAGVGALTAVIILVFKDTILSFVASIQITSYDLVRVGDWIEIPALAVDGDVMDIALHTIKVRNFDKTITTVPTNKLIEVSFKNWRGMQETGGRRIKRAVNIDIASIKFVDDKTFEKFNKFNLLEKYLSEKKVELDRYNKKINADNSDVVNAKRLTNIGAFRVYLKEYLKNREDIHKGLTFLVRQLAAGANGIPLEIYVFTTTTAWVLYEDIQADIFDHIFAVIPEFGLKVYQSPSSSDVRSLSEKIQ
ncbi:MAG: mechanosensitive ion channel family protein [Bacteroidetes bacterium]|nr:mechanosensitive ion channel family protein [Bacteroidota bacterium]MBU2506214.1 mechanosensitive ion channel family protein [Bacteroidota bacterium]